MTRITVEGLTKTYGRHKIALDNVSFDTRPGELIAIIGPSGCGKTTLLRCILGEVTADAGHVRFDEEPLDGVPIEHRRVGIVYQGYALFPHMSVARNVGYGLRVHRAPRHDIKRRVEEVLDLVRLGDKGGRMPHELSGGERQRVAIARALAVEPRVLLLDEAFAALDATTRARLLHDVRDLVRELGLTTLFVTHDQEDAFMMADRVLVMNEGRIIRCATPSALMIARDDAFLREFVHVSMYEKVRVQEDEYGLYVDLREAGRLQLDLTTLRAGDLVEVLVKRRPRGPVAQVTSAQYHAGAPEHETVHVLAPGRATRGEA